MPPFESKPTAQTSQQPSALESGFFRLLDSELSLHRGGIFEAKKPTAPTLSSGAHIVITLSEPGSYSALLPTIRILQNDPRCSTLTLLASGYASERIREDLALNPVEIAPPDSLTDAARARLSASPAPTIVCTNESSYAWQLFAFVGSERRNFGPSQLLFFAESPDCGGGLPIQSALQSGLTLATLQGVLCNDPSTRMAMKTLMPFLREEAFEVTGSGLTDSLRALSARTSVVKETARQRLGLSHDACCIAFLADLPGYTAVGLEKEVDDSLNARSLMSLAEGVASILRAEPGLPITLLYRAHPRDPSPEKLRREVAEALSAHGLEQLSCREAPAREFSREEILGASQIITSTSRSTLFEAPYCGCGSIFLGQPDAGGALLSKLPQGTRAALLNAPGVAIVSNLSELSAALLRFSDRSHASASGALLPFAPADGAANLASQILKNSVIPGQGVRAAEA